jgi:hypothetical protein
MTRAQFWNLVPVTIGVIACGYLLSRADDVPPADKVRDQQGLTGAAVSIRLKSGTTVYHIEHAILKSLGGQTFLTGNLLMVRERSGQAPPAKNCRAWIPINDIQALLEYKEDPFAVKPPDPPADPPADSN